MAENTCLALRWTNALTAVKGDQEMTDAVMAEFIPHAKAKHVMDEIAVVLMEDDSVLCVRKDGGHVSFADGEPENAEIREIVALDVLRQTLGKHE